METDYFMLVVCFLGAVVQITTGLGFGLIVAPMLLAFYEPVDAIQVTGALTLAIVATIVPFLRRRIMPRELSRLAVGTLVGLVIGSGLLLLVSITSIRIAALLALGYCLFRYLTSLAHGNGPVEVDPAEPTRERAGLIYGMASGVMSATLAMPGPLALVFLRGKGFDPTRIRATVFALMVGSYTGMLVISTAISGVSDTVLMSVKLYLLPSLAGVLIGQWAAGRLPDLFFDVTTTLLMLSTLIVLGVKIMNATF